MRTIKSFDFSPRPFQGKKGRSGARKGAKSALKNGTRMRLKLGELPPEMHRLQRNVRRYRVMLEDAVEDAHGEITLVHAHLIDAATTHEQHAQVCRWLLRQRLKFMKSADIRECSNHIAKAKDKRNQAVQALDLDAPPPNPWDAIDALPLLDQDEDDHDQHEHSQDGEAVHEEAETSTQETEEEEDHEQDTT